MQYRQQRNRHHQQPKVGGDIEGRVEHHNRPAVRLAKGRVHLVDVHALDQRIDRNDHHGRVEEHKQDTANVDNHIERPTDEAEDAEIEDQNGELGEEDC